jgi:predicted transcriptional regulator
MTGLEHIADSPTAADRRRLSPRQRAAMWVLWKQPDRFLTVRQVSEQLDVNLAYTTVMTLLSRLHSKGYLERRLEGRAWAYRPVLSRSEHTARAMAAALHDTDDRADVLSRFITHLTPEEQQALQRRLSERTTRS